MIYTQDITFQQLSIHKVGNKQQNETLITSSQPVSLTKDVESLLTHYFLSPFKTQEYYEFTHPSNLQLNEVFTFAKQIFSSPNSFHQQSINLAKHLYASSNHPNIKGGEFYVVHFANCILDGEPVDAVGLFKSENKETFLQIHQQQSEFDIEPLEGINIHKLDKGCLIMNSEEESGFVVAVVDKTNKTSEAQYWIDDFLQIQQREDDYFNTESTLKLYKEFVTTHLPEEYEINKADQADLLNRTMGYFKEKDAFNTEEFTQEVLQQQDVIHSFNNYKRNYAQEQDIQFANEFDISESAVKRQNRFYKSVIKLDKNFHIYVHGDRSKIEQGQDDRGKFYKVYFENEQ